MSSKAIWVMGAGIFGLSIAWELARRGVAVRVVEVAQPGAGSSGGLVGAILDVTAQKAAEFALRESEERWRTTIDSASEGMLIYDRELRIVGVNRAAVQLLSLLGREVEPVVRMRRGPAVAWRPDEVWGAFSLFFG